MPDEIGLLLLFAGLAFLGSLIYGITGFGAALVTIPIATHFVPLPLALAVFALMDMANSLRIGLQHPADAVRGELMRMVPLVLLGTIAGVTVLVNLPREGTMLALGVFVVLYAAYSLLRKPDSRVVGTAWAYVAGFVGGITSTLFGAGGPPYAIYLSHRPLAKEQFRATLTLTTVFSIGMRVLAFALTGLLLRREVLLAAVAVLPAAFVGVSLASRLFRIISHDLLRRLVGLLLLATGGSLIFRALG
ncbi:MAG: sulfite exporter TauE/SafE family protein [Burkholderiales bacterium]|nr:sulfite exporter TauE/SafE family protein [Burkholderiales bacterium]